MTPRMNRRILIVQFSARRDGSAMSALLLADGLREAGWETHVAFASPGPMEAAFEERGHTVSVEPHKNWLRAKSNQGFLRNVLRERQAVPRLRARMERVQPALVYVNTGASVAGVWAARKAGVPVLWHLRELFDDVGGELVAPSWLRAPLRRAIAAWPDRLVANSQAVARNVLGPRAGRATVVPNAVHDAFFTETRAVEQARSALGLPVEGSIVGVPGTLRPMKGHAFFFRAIAPLLRGRPGVSVAVTGDTAGACGASLLRLVDDLGLGAQVHFLGDVEDMPAFYRASTLVCVPSRAEPFGRTTIESFAVGTPVVASAVGGILEVVEDDVTGRLVSYGDENALAGILRYLLDAPDHRVRLAETARRVAEDRYRASTYTNRLRQLVLRSLDRVEGAT